MALHTVERDKRLDALDAWMDDFAKHPGASLMPEWLEALRALRARMAARNAAFASGYTMTASELAETQLGQMEEQMNTLAETTVVLRRSLAAAEFAEHFYGEHMIGRCTYRMPDLDGAGNVMTLVNPRSSAAWVCPPDCPVEARGV